MKRCAPPPDSAFSLPCSRSHHHCCSFDLIPLTSADLSRTRKRNGEGGGGGSEGRAYYPSSSALNYLNANNVRGRERGGCRQMMMGGRRRGETGKDSGGGLICRSSGVSGSSLVILKAS